MTSKKRAENAQCDYCAIEAAEKFDNEKYVSIRMKFKLFFYKWNINLSDPSPPQTD